MKPPLKTLVCGLLLCAGPAGAKMDLVTVPARDAVQVTIYNSADLTLVRESRGLTLRQGLNRLQFSWANTLIDPTSLSLVPLAQADQIDVFDLVFPPRVRQLGLWNIQSGVVGKVPVEISYLTSGLSWRAFYMGTLSTDETTMRLQGYVRVSNNSGEDYENARTRLVVGKVHILDQVSDLAKREQPYGRPGPVPYTGVSRDTTVYSANISGFAKLHDLSKEITDAKEIEKEGLSEYFVYTIEGTETIPHGWSKRLPSFEVAEVPVVNLYKYDEQRFGNAAVRFLSFKNDKAHQLGETPIPGGLLKVYQGVDAEAHLSYQGQSDFKYIPVDEDVELNLGATGQVTVEPLLMDFKTTAYQFNAKGGNISGWDEVRRFKVEVNNTRDVPAKVQVDRTFSTAHWNLVHEGAGAYMKYDLDTARFTLKLPPRSKREFTYLLTTRHGDREHP